MSLPPLTIGWHNTPKYIGESNSFPSGPQRAIGCKSRPPASYLIPYHQPGPSVRCPQPCRLTGRRGQRFRRWRGAAKKRGRTIKRSKDRRDWIHVNGEGMTGLSLTLSITSGLSNTARSSGYAPTSARSQHSLDVSVIIFVVGITLLMRGTGWGKPGEKISADLVAVPWTVF